MKYTLHMLLAVALLACAQNPAKDGSTVEINRLQAHMGFLASNSLAGRDTGSRGYQVAADYVAAEFQQMGLKPAGDDGSYFQQVPMIEHSLAEGSARVLLSTRSGAQELKYPEQFIMGPDRMVRQQQVSGQLVFAGYGIVAPEYDHDDYANLDVGGKIVVVLTGRPEAWPTEEGAHLSSGREKLRHAVEHGATGFVVLHTPRSETVFPYAENLKHLDVPGMSWVGTDGVPDGYYPEIKGTAYLNLDAAAMLFDGAPVPLEEIYAADSAQQPIKGFSLPNSLRMSRKSSYKKLQSPNVVAVIEGSDPELKKEYLVYSAHLDHLGVLANEDGVEEIYNGAMDNAAGVATLLETARVLAGERNKLKRSVLFLVVTGEEKGLLGSGYFAANPTVPIGDIVANINLDMPLLTFPFADVVAFGAEHSTLAAYVEKAAARSGIKLSPDPMPEQGLFTRSDHYKLVQQGVPAVFLVTGFESKNPDQNGAEIFQAFLKDHYHKPSDNLDLTIDFEAGRIFAEINIDIGREVCNSPERPRWNDGDFFGRTFAVKP